VPLILDGTSYDRESLRKLAEEMAVGLEELRPMTVSPKAKVLDPQSLLTAREMLDAALAVLRRPGERTDAELAADANLGYATSLAVLDLVKSHTEMPKVPPPRPAKGPAA
jgi:hypothetical protein